MTGPRPNDLFRVWSPDTVAECLCGNDDDDLYSTLWGMVHHYEGKPRSEVPDDFADRALSNWWNELTTDEKLRLNKLAKESER